MAFTTTLVEQRFDDAQAYTDDAIANVETYMDTLETLLSSLEPPATESLDEVIFPSYADLNYGAIPNFNELLNDFPTFDNLALEPVELLDVPAVDSSISVKNFEFDSNYVSKPNIDYPNMPEEPTLSSIALPTKPELNSLTEPVLDDLNIPAAPTIDIAKFDVVEPTLDQLTEPTEFNFVEDAYNSDIRVSLFNKILNDIINGGTGLDVTVEQDIYDRYLARQINENDRLFQEVQNQFAATGFGLPSGALAHRLLQVSSEISTKNDNASRDITINQAELEQKNVQFSVQQAVVLEQMLVTFFNEQQNRSLQAQQTLASNAIEVYNTLVAKQNLYIEKYKADAEVFQTKVQAELTAIEAYKAQVEGVKAAADVQESRVRLYTAQVAAQELFMQIYQTEMESAKINLDYENLKLNLFRTQTEAYVAKIQGEKLKVDVYQGEVSAEATRADGFRSEVAAYEAEVRGQLGVLESERVKAEAVINANQLKIEEYKTQLESYRVEIDAELRNADLSLKGYQANVSAYQAEAGVQEMKFRTQIAELSSQIELTKTKLQKALAEIESETNSYVALKELAIKGTEGIMNVNAQLAASAMNAVNASASQGITSSSSDQTSYSESHNYSYDG